MASSLIDLLHGLHRDAARVKREQRREAQFTDDPVYESRRPVRARGVSASDGGLDEYTLHIHLEEGMR